MENEDTITYRQMRFLNNSMYGAFGQGDGTTERWEEYKRKLLIKHRTDTINKLLDKWKN